MSKSHVQVLLHSRIWRSARPRRTFQQLTQLRMNWASYHFSAEEWLHYFVERSCSNYDPSVGLIEDTTRLSRSHVGFTTALATTNSKILTDSE
jgi:hypothetical protein